MRTETPTIGRRCSIDSLDRTTDNQREHRPLLVLACEYSGFVVLGKLPLTTQWVYAPNISHDQTLYPILP
jgi:hypothetical protein